ncbi:MBL fold metallo-hydrolase [Brevibacillus ginsengisoli]|uniref:MBL fold metallo-hydrolase n=1 Tax=Brevibacillus ginsengisoli TaxID=363854 RepID=UPI003CF6AE86
MRLTVLGCQSPYPGPNGATPGYLLQTDQSNILLDCGSGVISQLMKHLPLVELDAVCLSHYHHDHVADIGVLQYGIMLHQRLKDRTKGVLPVYGPANIEERGLKLTYQEATVHQEIRENSVIQIKDVQISFHRTQHDIPCYAMRIEYQGRVLVYGADSGPKTNWDFARDADLFICEGTFLERFKPQGPTGHLSIIQASQIAQELQAKKLMITHLFPAYKLEEIRAEMQGFTYGEKLIAEIGLQLQI